MFRIIGLSIVTVIASYLGVTAMLSWAHRRQRLDIPNDRSSHTTPTPHGGGLAIVAVVVLGVAIYAFLSGQCSLLWWYCAGGLLIAVVSWFDDLHDLPGSVRFGVHGIGAGLAIAGYGYWHDLSLPFVSSLELGWIGLVLTFFWIVGLTNVFNFMDGIDGIAGLQAVFAGLAWAVLGWWTSQPAIVLIALLIGSGAIGFLAHNWSPAKIFMGDVGSAFLGYSLAVLPLMATEHGHAPTRLALAGVMVMWPFVFDATLTLVRRALRGENVFNAHRSHLYQRMVIVGLSHRNVASLYGTAAFLAAAAALIWYKLTPLGGWLFVFAAAGLGVGLWLFAIGQERRHAANIAEPKSLAGERS
jgi:UDP-N-acetylmuramyl pentapeptide phosphotransferase/UDP-N-acetylglucosamine-1-phosphate transferase